MTKTFLLIDDDADDRELFSEALSEIDATITCHCISGGQEALDKLNNREIHAPDIIFIDINMPVMSGWQCLVKLKSNEDYKSIPVILYSTSFNPRDINIATESGALCLFTKPSHYNELKRILTIVVTCINGSSTEFICGAINKPPIKSNIN